MKKHLFLLPDLNTARELSEQPDSSGIDHYRIPVLQWIMAVCNPVTIIFSKVAR
ncbi:hypothetical protein [Endozoicomonas sp. YOMI1]|uniref:hypothetical protein n=1 Tax=Endozoicomonas sp. YOMI1 TaxID=2828739 RepID=UPI00214826BC|nr:hypothetical protein [Endozoicomonas sp. YOMI1]